MAQDSETKRTEHATLWEALCWLAYDDFDAHKRSVDRSVREDLVLAFNTSGHKRALLQAAQKGRIDFEGRLGARCDPPPSPSDTWEQFHWAAHSSAFSKIELTDWPAETDNEVIDWQNSGLQTPRGGFLDVRALRADVQRWHPGPRGQQQARAEHRGRKKGSGSYEALDAPLLEEMKRLIAKGDALSNHAAAMKVVDRAEGAGALESKVRRLINRFNEKFDSI